MAPHPLYIHNFAGLSWLMGRSEIITFCLSNSAEQIPLAAFFSFLSEYSEIFPVCRQQETCPYLQISQAREQTKSLEMKMFGIAQWQIKPTVPAR